MKNSGFPSERRRFERYPLTSGLAKGALMHLEVGDGRQLPVLNVSYGGILCSGGAKDLDYLRSAPAAETSEPMTGNLRLALTRTLAAAANLSRVHSGEGTVSFSFVHDRPDVLLFLRPWLECFRQASTLMAMEADVVKPELRAAGWMVWRGDGPITVSIKSEAPGKVSPDDWHIVFPRDDSYLEVGAIEGRVFTRESLDADGRPAGRVQSSGEVDKSAIDLAIAYLAGFAGDQNFTTNDQIALIDLLRSV